MQQMQPQPGMPPLNPWQPNGNAPVTTANVHADAAAWIQQMQHKILSGTQNDKDIGEYVRYANIAAHTMGPQGKLIYQQMIGALQGALSKRDQHFNMGAGPGPAMTPEHAKDDFKALMHRIAGNSYNPNQSPAHAMPSHGGPLNSQTAMQEALRKRIAMPQSGPGMHSVAMPY